uniref:Uncharacterized protein LOC111103231 n=1 Tax=Crassostrea virginica TaxID=6565 RepID=A0A8B8APE9_CRAVI|nr:uncharacterized protein LOC111103231 [Crassostrea virginica]
MDGIKKRKPNWSERELTVLAEAVTPRNKMLKQKFNPTLTSEKKQQLWKEIRDQLNSMTVVSRTIEEIKKKWADMQSLTKKKEAERRRSMGMTGGGPAQEYYFKDWEKVVLQSLSDVAIEGIGCGVDTAECGDILNANSTCMLPAASNAYLDADRESEKRQRAEKLTKSSRQKRGSGETDEMTEFLSLERQKMASQESYRQRKLMIMEEMLQLQRRSTEALEKICDSMQHKENSQPFSLSPVIKFS